MSMTEDFVAPFSLDNAPVRGRIVRLSAGALDPILRRHDYPRPVAMLLGEAISLAALVGALLDAKGRLIVQAQGEGPVPLLVAEYRDGSLRGYARMADASAFAGEHRLAPRNLLGGGALVMTLDQGDGETAYQGVVPLEGATLAECAQTYFASSQQTDTCIRLAVGEVIGAEGPAYWRGGGALMQRLASDQARGDTSEDWRRASLLFETLTDEELIDPALSADRLLYRLFHEEGVRMGDRRALRDLCTCDEDRLTAVMRQFPADELADLVEPDGLLHARCQFCARAYRIDPAKLGA